MYANYPNILQQVLSEMNVEKMQKPLRPSLFTEVNGLVKAFNFLTSSMLAMRAYMPESMFVKGTIDSAHGDEEETEDDLESEGYNSSAANVPGT